MNTCYFNGDTITLPFSLDDLSDLSRLIKPYQQPLLKILPLL